MNTDFEKEAVIDEAWKEWDVYRKTPGFDPDTAHAPQFIAGFQRGRQMSAREIAGDAWEAAVEYYIAASSNPPDKETYLNSKWPPEK